ncbi:MAG: hypothetical protein JWN45_2974 [Acidobacteriaceae bacterium]|nr:hypothetical protein [Acidobacteriaceae bacterium]
MFAILVEESRSLRGMRDWNLWLLLPILKSAAACAAFFAMHPDTFLQAGF